MEKKNCYSKFISGFCLESFFYLMGYEKHQNEISYNMKKSVHIEVNCDLVSFDFLRNGVETADLN